MLYIDITVMKLPHILLLLATYLIVTWYTFYFIVICHVLQSFSHICHVAVS